MIKLLFTLLAFVAVTAHAQTAAPASGNASLTQIPAQPLADALTVLARQRGLQMIYGSDAVRGHQSKGAPAGLSTAEVLARILEGTGLEYEFLNDRTVTIWIRGRERPVSGGAQSLSGQRPQGPIPAGEVADTLRLARTQAGRDALDGAPTGENTDEGRAESSTDEAKSKGIPEMLVKGARSSNSDIRRTEDDVQPYVVFEAEEIENSMAPDLETFLKTRLPMNQSRGSEGQNFSGIRGPQGTTQSTINLRGLGADQTLILVNGRRMPSAGNGLELLQPDINGIPLAAVERIEILPSTAGGIYGGGATGGVVNIILKRDYSDLELTARYDGTFAGGGAERRLDASGGFTLEGGRTSIMVMASYRDANPLYIGDRDFTARARALQNANDPGAFVSQSTPVHGYTTNIRSANGSDLVLVDDMRPLNTPIAYVPVGYAGPASDGGTAFLSTAGRYNLDLAADPAGRQHSLLNLPTVRSVAVNLRREFTDRIEAFVDASRHDSRGSRAGLQGQLYTDVTLPVGLNNPFTQAVKLSVPLPGYGISRRTSSSSLMEQFSGGLIVRLRNDWAAQGEYTWSQSTSGYSRPDAFLTQDGSAALIDGRLDPLGDVNAYPMDFSAYYPGGTGQRATRAAEHFTLHKDATLRVAGPLMNLPGGPLRLAALIESREQFTGDNVLTRYRLGVVDAEHTYYPKIGATTESVYAELTAPLFSAVNARRGLRGLDLQASYRYDETKTRSRPIDDSQVMVPSADGPFPDVPFQTNTVTGNQYTLGFRYTPAESVVLRASYGKGILPPMPSQLAESSFPPEFVGFLGVLTDSKRGGEVITDATVEKLTISGNPLLRPEYSQSWSAGAIFTPESLPGLRLSVDYTRIEKTDEVGFLDLQVLIDLEDNFPGRIVRDSLTAADQTLGYTGGVVRELNLGQVNIAHSVVEAVDIQADYSWQTRFGVFAANVMATVQPQLKQQAAPDSEEFDTVGYSDGPLKWRANAGLRWSRGALDLGWNMQYYDASRVYTSTAFPSSRDATVRGQGSEWTPTQTYHDVFGRYRFETLPGFARGLLENTELLVSVQNVFNDSPPILASVSPGVIAGYSTDGDPRLRRYSVSFTKRFGL